MQKTPKSSVLFFVLSLWYFLYVTKNLMTTFGPLRGMHLALLTWTFFVLCIPIARGRILFRPVAQRFFNNAPTEYLTWTLALTINALTLMRFGYLYYKTTITHLLYQILTTPWPLWTAIVCCSLATFHGISQQSGSVHKTTSRVLILLSIVITVTISFQDFVLVFNAHGNP